MSEPAPAEAHPAFGDSVVVLDQVVKRFGDVVAVVRSSMEIERGEYDSSEITSFLANRVILEMLAGIAFRRKAGTWDSIPKSLLEGRA